MNVAKVMYFYGSDVEHFPKGPKKIKRFRVNRSIIANTNITRIQTFDYVTDSNYIYWLYVQW